MSKKNLGEINISEYGKKNQSNALARLLSNRIFFAIHLFAYISVCGLLTLIWALTIDSEKLFFWPMHTMFGWGLGIGFHAITYLMYNDIVDYFAKVRRKSNFSILYIYHAFFFISINSYLLVIDLTTLGGLFFYWPLLMWGIGFGIHSIGFFTWENQLQKEINRLKAKIPNEEPRILKKTAISKISHSWFLLGHIAYFIVIIIIIFTLNLIYLWKIEISNLLDGIFLWGTLLGIQIFGYYLFFYNRTFRKVLKGLILHIITYSAMNGWMIYIDLKNEIGTFWFYYPLILWGIAIIIHLLVYFNWDKIKSNALDVAKRQFGERLDKYDLDGKANRFIFWKWSFITHIAIWACGIVIIGINLAFLRYNIVSLVYPALGWLIGVSVHCGCFIIVLKNIQRFLSWTAVLHICAFVSTSILLIVINILNPGFPWSAIAIAGWGIGLGIHILLARLT